MKIEKYRKHYFSAFAVFVLILSTGLNELSAQYSIKWLNVGNFHSPYSEGLVSREEEPWGNAPLMWPAIDFNSGNSRAQAFWMGATNFTDENSTTYPHKIAHIGPRSGGDVQFFAVEQSITSKFDPEVIVDGAKSFEKYVYVNTMDPSMLPDRKMTVSNNSRIGITTVANMNAFSQEYHDDYHIIEYTFTNTGNVDGDDDIELNSGLTGVYFFFIHRYMVHDASSWIRGGGAPWGKFTMNDAVGDGHEDYDVDFRAQYAWAGLNPDNASFSSIGGPMMFPHWASAGWDTTGRLAAGQMVGRVTIQSPDTYGGGDTGVQPRTMGVMGSDDPNLTTDEYDASLMQIQYNTYMASGRMYPHHADDIEPGGNFDTPTNAPNIFDGTYDEGGWSVIEGHGPYDIPFGQSVNIVVADGVGGLSMKAKYDIGKLYKATGSTPDESAMLSYNGSSLTKNQWALTAKDSLFKTFERALANHAAGYNIPQPPHPPEKFEVTSGTDKITLSWVAASGGPLVTGWHLYRAKGTYNFPYIGGEAPLANHGGLGHELIASLAADATSYEDATAARGENYYYFIQAVGNAAANDGSAMTPAGALKSNQHWTQTYLPASLKRAAGTTLENVRVVPNPYHVQANTDVRFSDQDRLAFLDVPANCTIKIYTQLGELVETIEHTDGSGDEYWDQTTSSRQVVASGLYIAHITDNVTDETAERKFVIIR
jgi:hypothetical protein